MCGIAAAQEERFTRENTTILFHPMHFYLKVNQQDKILELLHAVAK